LKNEEKKGLDHPLISKKTLKKKRVGYKFKSIFLRSINALNDGAWGAVACPRPLELKHAGVAAVALEVARPQVVLQKAK
jgi:hypothetical protein